jgi:hypothetical protein
MRTIIILTMLCATLQAAAQDTATTRYTIREPQMLRMPSGVAEPTPEWYLYKAGDNYNTGTWALLAGAMLGTGLVFSSSEGQQVAGAAVLGIGLGVGIGFHIAGNGKLMRAGWLQQQRLKTQ